MTSGLENYLKAPSETKKLIDPQKDLANIMLHLRQTK